jgi:MSHA biogenesis protein MshJ
VKTWWEKYAARIDALSQRERMFLFLSVMACCLAAVDSLWLSPAQQVQRQLVQSFDAQNTELNRLRTDLQATGRPSDEAVAMRKELESIQSKIDAINVDIQTSAPMDSGGPALEQVLMEFLRRQDGLTLLSAGTLRADATTAQAGPSTPTAPTAPNAATTAGLPQGLTRRGMELRVAGSYPELVRYVKTLEAALPKLRWGPMQLKSDKQVPELTLQVYIVGVQP